MIKPSVSMMLAYQHDYRCLAEAQRWLYALALDADAAQRRLERFEAVKQASSFYQ